MHPLRPLVSTKSFSKFPQWVAVILGNVGNALGFLQIQNSSVRWQRRRRLRRRSGCVRLTRVVFVLVISRTGTVERDEKMESLDQRHLSRKL